MDEKNFIKEKIVGQKISWKKKVVKALSFLFSGGVFGLGIFLVLFFLLPILPEKKEGKEKETVAFTEEASTEAESSTEETEAIEDVVQSEIQKLDFPISAYDSMMGNLKSIIQEGEKSLVDVEISTGGEDLLTEGKTRGNGIILEKTADSLLILYLGSGKGEEAYRIRFFREKEVEGRLLSSSKKDGVMILSVPLSAFTEKDLEKLSVMPRGNSRLIQRGETLIGIGSPSGELYSTEITYASYLSYDVPTVDGIREDIAVQGPKEGEGNVFYLNTAGEFVGFCAGKQGAFPHITGISDCLDMLEHLSNGKTLAYLGVKIQNTSKSMIELGIPEGIFISEVEEGSPAYAAGVQAGDVIKKVNGEELTGVKDLQSVLLKEIPGSPFQISLLRNNGNQYVEMEFSCPLGTR